MSNNGYKPLHKSIYRNKDRNQNIKQREYVFWCLMKMLEYSAH